MICEMRLFHSVHLLVFLLPLHVCQCSMVCVLCLWDFIGLFWYNNKLHNFRYWQFDMNPWVSIENQPSRDTYTCASVFHVKLLMSRCVCVPRKNDKEDINTPTEQLQNVTIHEFMRNCSFMVTYLPSNNIMPNSKYSTISNSLFDYDW